MSEVSIKLDKCMRFIDDIGAPPLSKPEWIELLEGIVADCESRIECAKEELKNEEEE